MISFVGVQPAQPSNGSFKVRAESDTSAYRAYAFNFTLIPVNDPPNQPMLVQPEDDATGVSMSPTLGVTITDPEEDAMSVSFYGRAVGEGRGEDFTFVVYPDTQNMATSYPAVFNSMSQYIADNKTSLNVAFATHVGDIVNTASSTTEWGRADTAMGILDTANVPYSVGPGNHDRGGLYNTYFGPSRFIGNGHYQGSYASGQNENNYSFFSASGMDFIIINLQYNSTTAHLDWADGLLKANPDRRGILVQHNILNTDNSWQNQAPHIALKDNPNLFLMLCGHMHTASDGSAYRAEVGDEGNTIHILLTDYQDYPNGGNGYLRLLHFSPADDKIYSTIYSPYTGSYLTSATNYEQFAMTYDMASSSPFTLIGTVSGVASGANASITWAGLHAGTEYEWHIEVSDSGATTTGPTWSFTSGAAAVVLPIALRSHPRPGFPNGILNR
jgi:hypothetical protein